MSTYSCTPSRVSATNAMSMSSASRASSTVSWTIWEEVSGEATVADIVPSLRAGTAPQDGALNQRPEDARNRAGRRRALPLGGSGGPLAVRRAGADGLRQRGGVAHAQDDHRRVVALGSAPERLEPRVQPRDDRAGLRCARGQQLEQPLLAEAPVGAGHVEDAVRVEDEDVAGPQRRARELPAGVRERAG